MPKPSPRPGEIWVVDAGYLAKIWPCLLLTGMPNADELDLVTVVFHTTALRATRWEVQIPKPFLKEGAFNVQQIHTSPTPRLERKLGELTRQEFDLILDKIAERLSL